MASLPSPGLPARWADILESVQQALAQAEADAARSAQGLESFPADPAAPAWERHLDELTDQARHLDACTANADRAAGDVEAALQASETTLRQWLAQADALRRKLATGAGVPV